MPRYSDQYLEIYGRKISAMCPKCGREHKLRENWTGRGKMRKFCPRFRATIDRNSALSSDDIEHTGGPIGRRIHQAQEAPSMLPLIPQYR
jgi:hypothetical protein